jgi:membrane associated rhomboid family serine protease
VIHVAYLTSLTPVVYGYIRYDVIFLLEAVIVVLIVLSPQIIALLTYIVLLFGFKFKKKRALKISLIIGLVPIVIVLYNKQVFMPQYTAGTPTFLDLP